MPSAMQNYIRLIYITIKIRGIFFNKVKNRRSFIFLLDKQRNLGISTYEISERIYCIEYMMLTAQVTAINSYPPPHS